MTGGRIFCGLLSALRGYEKEGGVTLLPAKALGPGLDIEKYIRAAFVVPKSSLDPVSWTALKASRNI